MHSVKEAETIILDRIQPVAERETVPRDRSPGRILAEPIRGEFDFPYEDNSAMDGYAVRYGDVESASTDNPVSLTIIEEIPAGKAPSKSIHPGETARIFTGAIVPDGADTIVMQENTRREGDRVLIFSPPDRAGTFVRKRGAFYRSGDLLLSANTPINAPEMAVLATAGCIEVPVFRRPRVAIFSTGDELVNPGEPLQTGRIVDSNRHALTAFVTSIGAIPIPLGIVRDNPDDLRETMQKAIDSADIVLSTGGVSVGDYDYIEKLLEELGGEIHIRSVAIQPGKPLTVATFPNNCLYFGIPGNPVSALVTCWRFVRGAIGKLSGRSDYQIQFRSAIARDPLKSKGEREVYFWGRVEIVNGMYEFHLAPGQYNSANLINLAGTNALAVLPKGRSIAKEGETVEILLV
ncbi:gephyrin-like molybdotransferase Glp [Pannus brasiliensis CCIBt3594]|uniref:Molybdopterin molybdenumtransferase n=1 Tax=Pannus brasiliensis CCIBt3594 TaxID=1427578 RepID=A0AAW9QZ55_9CHRO